MMEQRRHSTIRNQLGVTSLALAIFVLACGGLYWSRSWLAENPVAVASGSHPPLYLPDTRYVRTVTLGFDTLASKILWFNTINYFGKQFSGAHDYRWLGHMCDLVTDLDPKTSHVFEFCATLLSWVAKDWNKSIALLDRAIDHEPNYWRYHYLRAFNYWYFANDFEKASAAMLRASSTPDAPPFVQTLSSRMLAKEAGPTVARQFLQDLLKNAHDPNARKIFRRKLKKARLAESVAILKTEIEAFQQTFGRRPEKIEELVQHGFLDSIPTDPYKGQFYLDAEGNVQTTSGKTGLRFAGKTASTGVARHEFIDNDGDQ